MDEVKGRKPGVTTLQVIAAWLTTAVVTWSGKTLTAPTLTDPVIADPKISTAIKDTNGNPILAFTAVAGAVNYVRLVNATSSSPAIRADGTAANVNINLQPRGTGVIRIVDSAGTIVLAAAPGVASAVNSVLVTNAATGVAPSVKAAGEANIDLIIGGNGTGVVKDPSSRPFGVKVAVPTTAGSAGVPGQWAVDGSYAYFCTAPNTWVRAAVATW